MFISFFKVVFSVFLNNLINMGNNCLIKLKKQKKYE